MSATFQTEEIAYYADTDAYGVVWHGSYLRWLERARFGFCKNFNVLLSKLEEKGIVFPVIEINLRYLHPVKLHDHVVITTQVMPVSRLKLAFYQDILKDNQIYLKAKVVVATVKKDGSICHPLPIEIQRLFDLNKA